MRPLPRLHAITDGAVLALDDFPVRAAAIASAGPGVALHARDRGSTAQRLTAVGRRLLALARPAEASVFINARPDLAAALHAHGLQLGKGDLSPGDAREAFGDLWQGWIGVSVHSGAEAERAVEEGADYLMVGNVWETATHPGRPGVGLGVIRAAASLGRPVIAIGGMTDERAAAARQAGAYGVAAISALWHTSDPARMAMALLAPWAEAA
ncbi:MAG TPA: thiamine phosphate synthase [Gemmatimonadales bacterium]|jgi:thiamine-phosphate pyrophosphorylase